MSPNPYLIPAIKSLTPEARVTLPGSKSIALRQMAMSALAKGKTVLHGVPPCDDTEAMVDCLQQLGATVTVDGATTEIIGPIEFDGDVHINARMSGASTRLLIGMAALRSGKTTIDGHASLRARTNTPLLDVLVEHGCNIDSDTGGLPATIQGPLRPKGPLRIDGSVSSQYISALLLCAPLCAEPNGLAIEITGELVSRPYIDITLNELKKRGIHAQWQNTLSLEVAQGSYNTGEHTVEGDATAATYFAALATLHGSSIELTNLGAATYQGDYAFLDVMEKLGAEVVRAADSTTIQGPKAVKPLPLVDMNDMPDAALTLIAMAPLLPGTSRIEGLSSLHHKECDRLECPAKEFEGLGIQAKTTYDSIEVEPINPLDITPHVLTTYHDHRMAMAFSTLGSVSGNITVDDKAVVNKTYPAYWQDYTRLGAA